MSKQGRKQRRKSEVQAKAAKSDGPRVASGWVKRAGVILCVCVCLVIGVSVIAFTRGNGKMPSATKRVVDTKRVGMASTTPQTLDELLALPVGELAKVDFARMNLLCAQGLPGAEKLDLDACLSTLDQWAKYAGTETIRTIYKFKNAPKEYESSEGYFRMLLLNTVLQEDLKVHYNPERIRNVDFRNAKDLFIHGMILDPNGGTCASMPVLLTAIARRMGYPVRLVTAKGHVFCRWESPGDVINLDPSGVGLNTHKDEYYKAWPMTVSDLEIKQNHFLVSLTPAEELGMFMEGRGDCLLDNGRYKEAEMAYAAAVRLSPQTQYYRMFLATARRKQITRVVPTSEFYPGSTWSTDMPEALEPFAFNQFTHDLAEMRKGRYSSALPSANPNPYINAGQQPGPPGQGNAGNPRGAASTQIKPSWWKPPGADR